MADDGQMILLSALVACLCMVGVIACVSAVSYDPGAESGYLSADTLDNILWAQGESLKDIALHQAYDVRDSPRQTALNFARGAEASSVSLFYVLLRHGVAYEFTFNDRLARDFLSANPGNGRESYGGVILERHNSSVKIFGCAYDVTVEDGRARYHKSLLSTF